tara:strand:+ start:327 stop:581 length:255 start_codon:yes stop_codon:yes gene_type:complete
MKNKLTYESHELEEKDLVVFYYQEGVENCLDFTLHDFVPEDYYIGVRNGTEEYEIHDYSPKDWLDETVSHKDLCKLVKEFEDGH